MKNGFTLVEILITMAVLVVILGTSSLGLVGYKDKQQFTADKTRIVSLLRDAGNRAISRQNGLDWGVHFDNTTPAQAFFTLFSGSSYATGTKVSVFYLNSAEAFSVPAAGNSFDIVFAKSTGLVSTSSTVSLYLKNNPSASSTVSVDTTGRIGW